MITPEMALAQYLAMSGSRSISALHRHITALTLASEAPGAVGEATGEASGAVSERTLKEWSRRNGWVKRAAEFDARAGDRVASHALTLVVDEEFDRIRDLTRVARNCLAAAAMIQIDPEKGTAADIRALTSAAIDAIKTVEVLSGGVSDRTERSSGMATEAAQLLRQLEEQKRARSPIIDVTPTARSERDQLNQSEQERS